MVVGGEVEMDVGVGADLGDVPVGSNVAGAWTEEKDAAWSILLDGMASADATARYDPGLSESERAEGMLTLEPAVAVVAWGMSELCMMLLAELRPVDE